MDTINSHWKILRTFLRLAIVSFAILCVAGGRLFGQGNDGTTAKAADLFAKGNLIDAYPLYEKLAADQPSDARIHYNYAFCLLAKSNSLLDAETKRQMRVKARQEFQKAKELDITEPNINGLLDSLPPDGVVTESGFSRNKQADDYMNQAEASFTKGEMDAAFDLYQKALKIDPQIYEAALYSGDVMTNKEKFDDADKWYMTAVRINPFRETAYRYSATPLMKQRKYEQAKMRYIEAYITDPYNRYTSGGMIQWAQVAGRHVGHPKIDIPSTVGKAADGNTSITLDASANEEDGSVAWTAYGLSRALWITGKDGNLSERFHNAYPKEVVYRHSLAEEYEGLKMVVTTLKEAMARKDSKIKKLDPALGRLVELYDKGLLESYILLAKADQGVAKDHMNYLEKNRDKLRQYVVEYVAVDN